jgi:hypothetical protein
MLNGLCLANSTTSTMGEEGVFIPILLVGTPATGRLHQLPDGGPLTKAGWQGDASRSLVRNKPRLDSSFGKRGRKKEDKRMGLVSLKYRDERA